MPGKHPLEKAVRRLRRRMLVIEIWRRVLQCLLVASVALLVLLLLQKFALYSADVWLVAPILAGIAFGIGLVWAFVKRPPLIAAAVAADERLSLRERISSGMCMVHSERPMEQAVVEDAQTHAHELRASKVFPFPVHREFKWLISIVAVILAVHFFVPPMNLFAGISTDRKATEKPMAADEKKKATEELKQLKEQLSERTDDKDPLKIAELDKDLAELLKQLETKKIERSEALAKVSKLSDKLDEKKEGMESKLKDFQDLKPQENAKFTKEISKDMESGRFNEAAQKIEELKKQLKEGKLTEQDKKQLANEMKKLAEQLKDNPELAKSLQDSAEKMNSGEMGQAMESMEMAQQDLQQLAESLQQMQELDQLSEKMGECKSGLCQGDGKGQGEGQEGEGSQKTTGEQSRDWKAGESMKKGSGMGGAGQGKGAVARVAEDTVKTNQSKVKGEMQKGKILSMIRVEGEQIKGESNIAFDDAVVEYSQIAEDTIDREPMPKEYKNLVRDYFDSIRGDVDKSSASPTPAAGE